MSKISVSIIIAISILSGAFSGYYFAHQSIKKMDFPVAIVDWKSFIDNAIVDDQGRLQADKVQEGMKTAQFVAENLKDQGYVVIESQAIMAAPEFYYVRSGSDKKEGTSGQKKD